MPDQRKAFAITMVYNDDYYLNKWYNYYGRELGHENLYIVAHGQQDTIEDIAPLANIITIPRDNIENLERRRWIMLSHFVGALLTQYYCGIVGDVDEMVVVDPIAEKSLLEFVTSFEEYVALFPIGMELFQHLRRDKEIDEEKPLLQQRRNAYFSHNYTKANVIYKFADIRNGAHGIDDPNATIPKHLFMIHLKYATTAQIITRREVRKQIVEEAGTFSAGSVWVREAGKNHRPTLRKAFHRKFVSMEEELDDFRGKIGFVNKPGISRTKRVFTTRRFLLPDRFTDIF